MLGDRIKKLFLPQFNQIWCVSYSYKWHVQRHNYFGPGPWGLWKGPKGQISLISIIKSISKILKQTLCVSLQMKDIKHTCIRCDFHPVAWVMPHELDLGVMGSQKLNLLVIWHIILRGMISRPVYTKKNVICDVEAHTMFMIFRGEGSKEEDPFREWFSKLGELRSLCPKAQVVALTATAGPTQRRKIVRSLCFSANSKVIHDSPDRSNIKISSKCIPNNEIPDKTFKWLFSELHTCAENLQRHVIFCQSISDVSKVNVICT